MIIQFYFQCARMTMNNISTSGDHNTNKYIEEWTNLLLNYLMIFQNEPYPTFARRSSGQKESQLDREYGFFVNADLSLLPNSQTNPNNSPKCIK